MPGEVGSSGTCSVNVHTENFICYRCDFRGGSLYPLLRESGIPTDVLERFRRNARRPIRDVSACSLRPLKFWAPDEELMPGFKESAERAGIPIPVFVTRHLMRRLGEPGPLSTFVRKGLVNPFLLRYDVREAAIVLPVHVDGTPQGYVKRYMTPKNKQRYATGREMPLRRMLTCADGNSVYVGNTERDDMFVVSGGTARADSEVNVIVEGMFDMLRLQREVEQRGLGRKFRVWMSYGKGLSHYQLFALSQLRGRTVLCWDGADKDRSVASAYAAVESRAWRLTDLGVRIVDRLQCYRYAKGDPGEEAPRILEGLLNFVLNQEAGIARKVRYADGMRRGRLVLASPDYDEGPRVPRQDAAQRVPIRMDGFLSRFMPVVEYEASTENRTQCEILL